MAEKNKSAYDIVPLKEDNRELPVLPIFRSPHGWGARHTQVLLLFISLSVAYSIKSQLSISLVAMTSNSTLKMWYPSIPASCLYHNNISDSNVTGNEMIEHNGSDPNCRGIDKNFKVWNAYRVYKWNKDIHEMILFSFYLGYTTMMLPMGLIAQKYGGKITILIALATNGVLSIVTPWVPIFSGWLGVCACRLLQGMTQATFHPSVHTILGKWAPVGERARLSSYIYTGSQFGTVVAFQIAGVFAGSPSLGWPMTFWFLGVLCLVCFGLLAWLGAATPYDHPNISCEEFAYITEGGNADVEPKKRSTPWRHILTSPPVWGIVLTHVGSVLGYVFILTQIPLYMSKVLGVDIKSNGLLSSLPYISMYVTSIIFGVVADWVANKKYLSVVNVRRVSNTIALVVSSGFLVAFSYINSTTVAVIFLVLCLGTHSGMHTGFHINHIDLSPNFAGAIMAFSNMISHLSTLVIPVAVSSIVGDDMKNQHKWQTLILLIAGIQTLANAVYVVFARGTVQPWNFFGGHDNQDTEVELDDEVKETRLQKTIKTAVL